MTSPSTPLRSGAPRTLAAQLVDALGREIRDGTLAPGDKLPTESAIMAGHGVSRTVVREALSKMQAAGLVETRHGVGTFVLEGAGAAPFHIGARHLSTLQDVLAVLELRIAVETEAAALAAQRRTARHLAVMRKALDEIESRLALGQDALDADYRFHAEIARATQNAHFAGLLASMGSSIIPRARLDGGGTPDVARLRYLQRINGEHQSIFDAIERQDPEGARAAMRMHLANSRERHRSRAVARASSARQVV